jgi:hypothetical protein
MAQLNFDASTVQSTSTFEALPAGDYPAIITGSEMKTTKAGDGTYLALTIEFQGNGATGRKLWHNLNIQNKNPQAVEISQKHLKEICDAVGLAGVGDSSELHNKPLVVKLGAKMDSYSGEMRNEAKGFKKLQTTATAPAFKAPTAAAPAAAPASKQGLPWAK